MANAESYLQIQAYSNEQIIDIVDRQRDAHDGYSIDFWLAELDRREVRACTLAIAEQTVVMVECAQLSLEQTNIMAVHTKEMRTLTRWIAAMTIILLGLAVASFLWQAPSAPAATDAPAAGAQRGR